MAARFVQKMHHFILQHTMIEDGETILVAVSGGADSLALLYGLHFLQPHLNCKLHVIHLNHGLRNDSTEDAEFVREHATHLDLPFTIQTVKLHHLSKQWKLSIETAGRRIRYEFYESACEQVGATKVALGHNQDDIAETVLMNLIRGTGTDGLKGIAPFRDRKFVRPLLVFTRQQIESFLNAVNLVPRQDSTNTDKTYLRNQIRHELIPILEKHYNPNIKIGLSRTADVLCAESDCLHQIVYEAFDACTHQLSQPSCVKLDREIFLGHHIALQRRILKYSIEKIHRQADNFYFDHYQAILHIINGDKPNAVIALPKGLQFKREYNQLIFENKSAETKDYSYVLNVPGNTFITTLDSEIIANIYDLSANNCPSLVDGTLEAMFDYNKVQLPLIVRNRRIGDKFQPHGMKGTKKVKDYFIDAKVASSKRKRIPLIVSNDEIIWIIGYTTNDRYKITSNTQKCLHLHYAGNEAFSENRSNF